MLFLDKEDRISARNWLTSGQINAAQRLLKDASPEVGGLLCCTLGATFDFPKIKEEKWLQIVHDGVDHWVLVAKGFGKFDQCVDIYDSLATPKWEKHHILSCMSSLLGTSQQEMSYVVKNCQQQQNSFDCGVFAIAFATSLVFGQNPSDVIYNTHHLRKHLKNCLDIKKLSLFPTSASRVNRAQREIVKTIPVFCHCRRTEYGRNTEEWEMIECSGCLGWFHRMCENYPKNTAKKWHCKICKKKK